jgi:sulfhydrogenase subunit beta (sulfur reductase)
VDELRCFPRPALDELIDLLRTDGYAVIGPVVRDDAIVLDRIMGTADLPVGRRDAQGPGHYRLTSTADDELFGFAVGPVAWKRELLPPRERLWRARRTVDGFELLPEPHRAEPLAFIGVRPCELAALHALDEVFEGDHADPPYASRRGRAFVVAVDCARPAATCFCASMGTGPSVTDGDTGADLVVSELVDGGHRFVARAASAQGRSYLDRLATVAATPADIDELDARHTAAVAAQVREVEVDGLPALLARRMESSHWDDVADRCLACANCTLVCPTCFCHTIEDTTDHTGDEASRWRRWDSCFTEAFTHLHGGSVRVSTRARYRQWLTHKFGTWEEQFGHLGCVGCGRCITWCPVGIDVTAELAALRALDEAVATVRSAP